MLRSVFAPTMGTCVVALALMLAAPIQAQDQASAANPDDVGSVGAIITALYDVISGPMGQDRDRDRFVSLFAEGARLIPTGRNPEGQIGFRMMSPDAYWSNGAENLKNIGFTEDEIRRTTETFGNITHAFSTYASFRSNGAENLKNIGFTEDEIRRTTETFGNITHAFSTYASFRQDRGDPDTAFSRGINSIQLLNDGNRWWVISIFWDSERPDNQIPSKYIGG